MSDDRILLLNFRLVLQQTFGATGEVVFGYTKPKNIRPPLKFKIDFFVELVSGILPWQAFVASKNSGEQRYRIESGLICFLWFLCEIFVQNDPGPLRVQKFLYVWAFWTVGTIGTLQARTERSWVKLNGQLFFPPKFTQGIKKNNIRAANYWAYFPKIFSNVLQDCVRTK